MKSRARMPTSGAVKIYVIDYYLHRVHCLQDDVGLRIVWVSAPIKFPKAKIPTVLLEDLKIIECVKGKYLIHEGSNEEHIVTSGNWIVPETLATALIVGGKRLDFHAL